MATKREHLDTIGQDHRMMRERERYLELDAGFTQYLTWSNNPQNLDLYGAFSKDEPNLSSDYNIKDLRPILKEEDGDKCLLENTEGSYYLWDLWAGVLLKVAEKWTIDDDLDTEEEVVENVPCSMFWVIIEGERALTA